MTERGRESEGVCARQRQREKGRFKDRAVEERWYRGKGIHAAMHSVGMLSVTQWEEKEI